MTEQNKAAPSQEPAYTTGHCENKKHPKGCQLHNLHCGWPKCDRKPVEAAPSQEPDDAELLRFAINEEFLLFCSDEEVLDIMRTTLQKYRGTPSDAAAQIAELEEDRNGWKDVAAAGEKIIAEKDERIAELETLCSAISRDCNNAALERNEARDQVYKLKDIIEEQLLSITALNDCIGGEGSLTTDNLVKVERLEHKIKELKIENFNLREAFVHGGRDYEKLQVENEELREAQVSILNKVLELKLKHIANLVEKMRCSGGKNEYHMYFELLKDEVSDYLRV